MTAMPTKSVLIVAIALGALLTLAVGADAQFEIPQVQHTPYDPDAMREYTRSTRETMRDLQLSLLEGKRRKLLKKGDHSDPQLWERIARIDARIDELKGISPADRARTTSLQTQAELDRQTLEYSRRIAEAEARRAEAEAKLAELEVLAAEREGASDE